MSEIITKEIENVDELFKEIIINGQTFTSDKDIKPKVKRETPAQQPAPEQEPLSEPSEPVEVTKTIENVDEQFFEIVINGNSIQSDKTPVPETKISRAPKQEDEEEEGTVEPPSKGQNVKSINLNNILHDFEDPNAYSEIRSIQTAINQLQQRLNAIVSLIPSEATEDNQLADKDFVNSSVATNTANLITNNGQPFTSVEELEAYSGTLTNNDYAYVTGTDSYGNTFYDRYKYNDNTQQWGYEFRLNNSSFTAEQWNTINSGLNENSFKTINEQSILGEGDITIESDKGVEVTQEEYDELPEEEKANGTVYYCKDGLPQDIRIIDDSVVQEETTWSSEKIQNKLNEQGWKYVSTVGIGVSVNLPSDWKEAYFVAYVTAGDENLCYPFHILRDSVAGGKIIDFILVILTQQQTLEVLVLMLQKLVVS